LFWYPQYRQLGTDTGAAGPGGYADRMLSGRGWEPYADPGESSGVGEAENFLRARWFLFAFEWAAV